VNLVSDRLVACGENKCEIYQDGSWQHLQNTMHSRSWHSSVATEDAVLLIGGSDSKTTEWVQVGPTSPAQREAFSIRHGDQHCTIKTSADVIVVTGGYSMYSNDFEYVTQYQIHDGTETILTPMGQPRYHHACGVYLDANNQQILLVTGGTDDDFNLISSTEVASYTAGSPLTWSEVEGGQLPTPRTGLRASTVNSVLYVSGGEDANNDPVTSILSWDNDSETWTSAGDLKVARHTHAAVAIPSSIIESECPALT